MAPVISFVGWSEVGKTTLIEQVIRQLKKREYKVAVIKHTCHEVQFDTPGKDTWRFRAAGSDVVALSGPTEFILARKDAADMPIADICSLIGSDVDIIIAEGYKAAGLPAIEVHARDSTEIAPQVENLVAVVGEGNAPKRVPRFKPADSDRIASFIVDNFIKPQQAAG